MSHIIPQSSRETQGGILVFSAGRVASWSLEGGVGVGGVGGGGAHAEVRNRPLRVGATHREATKPSEASAERGRERREGAYPLKNTPLPKLPHFCDTIAMTTA